MIVKPMLTNDNERFTQYERLHCHAFRPFRCLSLQFCQQRHRNVLQCVQKAQHDIYLFSIWNELLAAFVEAVFQIMEKILNFKRTWTHHLERHFACVKFDSSTYCICQSAKKNWHLSISEIRISDGSYGQRDLTILGNFNENHNDINNITAP